MREDAECAFFLSIHLLVSQLFDGHLLGKDSLELSHIRPGQRETVLLVDILFGMCNLFPGTSWVLRLQNQLYRLSSVRNDLHIAEFFEPIFAEFNANP